MSEIKRIQGMVRSIDQWRNMVPSVVVTGSMAQVEYALADAKTDIEALWLKVAALSSAAVAEREPVAWQPMDTAPKGCVTEDAGIRGASEWFFGRVSPEFRKQGAAPFVVIRRRAWPQEDSWCCNGEAHYVPRYFDAWAPLGARTPTSELEAENARLRAERDEARQALEEIRDLKERPYEEFPADWREQIAVCPECKRYADHPLQRGICDEHRRPLYAREDHDKHETKILGYRAKDIARDALARRVREGGKVE